ncbi:MAG: UDP-N-acetylglucosamine 2-epimerase (hydrolyzing), partial [Bacteroidia bacterium]|nr:UDP-N-acetylglucosamine 2-epimerase (hydrolyzing) [Bacteroidia bacterium]
MKILVLSSTRADYSFYLPLLKKMRNDPFFNVEIVAFGSHLSDIHGNTVERIEQDGFKVAHKLKTNFDDDSSMGISLSIGDITKQFAKFWNENASTVD